MVATHDIELTEMLKTTCENWHFSEQIDEDEGISFDYRVKKGAAKTRNAIALLSVLEYPDTIVTNAKHAAQHFDEQRTWLDLN
jgi:DNA mismatch repair ATPase MutS